MPTFKQPISVLVVIYTDAGKVLLLERADHPNYWQSVTGSKEADETLWQTAAREVQEETGLDVDQHELSDSHTHNVYEIYPHWRHRYAPGITQNIEHVFALKLRGVVDVKLSAREHLSYQWLSFEAAAEKVFSPSNRAAILHLATQATARLSERGIQESRS